MPARTYTLRQHVAAMVFAAVASAVLAWSAGVYCGRVDVQKDAAKLGLGVYRVDKASGKPVFKWNMSLLPAE